MLVLTQQLSAKSTHPQTVKLSALVLSVLMFVPVGYFRLIASPLDTHSQLFSGHIKTRLSRFKIVFVQLATDKINAKVVGGYGT